MVELKFDDPDEVVTCADGPWRNVPGFSSLLTMTLMLLAGPVPDDVWVLVIGEVGGLELAEFAQANLDWHFDGVGPSAPMRGLAVR